MNEQSSKSYKLDTLNFQLIQSKEGLENFYFNKINIHLSEKEISIIDILNNLSTPCTFLNLVYFGTEMRDDAANHCHLFPTSNP